MQAVSHARGISKTCEDNRCAVLLTVASSEHEAYQACLHNFRRRKQCHAAAAVAFVVAVALKRPATTLGHCALSNWAPPSRSNEGNAAAQGELGAL